MKFDESISIRAVSAVEYINAVNNKICFLDSANKVRYSYDPYKLEDATREIKLKQNQQLIGVYGKYYIND